MAGVTFVCILAKECQLNKFIYLDVKWKVELMYSTT